MIFKLIYKWYKKLLNKAGLKWPRPNTGLISLEKITIIIIIIIITLVVIITTSRTYQLMSKILKLIIKSNTITPHKIIFKTCTRTF